MYFPIEILLLLFLPLFLTLLIWNWLKPNRVTIPAVFTILSSLILGSGICNLIFEIRVLKELNQDQFSQFSNLDEAFFEIFIYTVFGWFILLVAIAVWFLACLYKRWRGGPFHLMKD
jgi:formate hydrogenlyase subunit 3/multisubunit Na+/H+ antiporter MnhD subunit